MGEQKYSKLTFLDFFSVASSFSFGRSTFQTPSAVTVFPLVPPNGASDTVEYLGGDCRIFFISYSKRDDVRFAPTIHCSDIADINSSADVDLLWVQLLPEGFGSERFTTSLAESLLRERMRASTSGVTFYEVSQSGSRIILMHAGRIYCSKIPSSLSISGYNRLESSRIIDADDEIRVSKPTSGDGVHFALDPIEAPVSVPLQPAICPSSDDLVACVSNGELVLGHVPTNTWSQLSHEMSRAGSGDGVFVGMPSFVVQEEFDRYIGFWWRPYSTTTTDELGHVLHRYQILYEVVDERSVGQVHLVAGDLVETHRYPKSGSPNATSDLRVCEFDIAPHGELISVRHLCLCQPLYHYLPGFEYLVRAGWTPDGQYIWCQLCTRGQDQLDLILVPLNNFHPTDAIPQNMSTAVCSHCDLKGGGTTAATESQKLTTVSMSPCIRLLREEDVNYWVQVHNCFTVLHHHPQFHSTTPELHSGDTCLQMTFIWSSHRTGFRHLYLMQRSWKSAEAIQIVPTNRPALIVDADEVFNAQLTSGHWEVMRDKIWVDEAHQLVVFHGNREHPILKNVYTVSYAADSRGQITLLIPLLQTQANVASPATESVDFRVANRHPSPRSSPPVGIEFDPAFPKAATVTSDATDCATVADYPLSFELCSFDPRTGWGVLTSSSLNRLPGFQVVRLQQSSPQNGQQRVVLRHIAWLKRHHPHGSAVVPTVKSCAPPHVFRFDVAQATSHYSQHQFPSMAMFTTPSGTSSVNSPVGVDSPDLTGPVTSSPTTYLYGQLFLPSCNPPSLGGYPTVHLVYGGPEFQLVRGSYPKSILLHAMLYCHFGYAVFVCDCRGSANRGMQFAGHVKYRLGHFELDDHAAFLRSVARFTGLIDLSRVAITGYSYGGYLSLMGIMRYHDLYKAAIAGSPVSDWSLYDTAYTERYMGLPQDNASVYRLSSVLSYVQSMPLDTTRLIICHGGQDENVHFQHTVRLLHQMGSVGRPYKLLYYPNSRHRIRDQAHVEASLLLLLEEVLKPVRSTN